MGQRQQPVAEAERKKRKGSREAQREGRGEGGDEEDIEDEGEWDTETVAPSPSDDEALDILKTWLSNQDTGDLSLAQSGALLALCLRRSGMAFGAYLSLRVSGSSGARTGRQRSLLPLPLKPDSVEALRQLFESGEYRRLAGASAAKKGEKANKIARRTGLLIWHGLVTALLNMMWTGGGKKGDVHRGPVTVAQADPREDLGSRQGVRGRRVRN